MRVRQSRKGTRKCKNGLIIHGADDLIDLESRSMN